jgi:hypothetical protein
MPQAGRLQLPTECGDGSWLEAVHWLDPREAIVIMIDPHIKTIVDVNDTHGLGVIDQCGCSSCFPVPSGRHITFLSRALRRPPGRSRPSLPVHTTVVALETVTVQGHFEKKAKNLQMEANL